MKLSRLALLGSVAAVASLTLAPAAPAPRAPRRRGYLCLPHLVRRGLQHRPEPLGHDHRRWLERPGQRAGRVDQRLQRPGQGRHDQLRQVAGLRRWRHNFLSGAYDFAGSDSPLNADQTTQSKALCTDGGVNIPVYLDGVAIIFNIPGVTELKLSGETIAKIFALQITDWSDPGHHQGQRHRASRRRITTVARSDGSGTTQNFTNYLAATQSSVWTSPAGKDWPIEGNVSKQKGGSGVVEAVKAGSGTIGYADHSAIGDLNAASVIQDGTAVAYSPEAVTATFEAAPSTPPTASRATCRRSSTTRSSRPRPTPSRWSRTPSPAPRSRTPSRPSS